MSNPDSKRSAASPLDRLIHLIARIEVDRYLQEVRALQTRQQARDHEGSDLREIQR